MRMGNCEKIEMVCSRFVVMPSSLCGYYFISFPVAFVQLYLWVDWLFVCFRILEVNICE